MSQRTLRRAKAFYHGWYAWFEAVTLREDWPTEGDYLPWENF